MHAIVNIRLYDYENYIESGYVIFDEKIVETGPMEAFNGADTILDGRGRLLMPGFVNFHTHVYSAFARGCDFKASPSTFIEVLKDVWWKLDEALSLEDLYGSAIAYGKESIKKGVVGIIDHNASGAITGSTQCIEKAFSELGIHGITCFETSDRFSLQEAIDENLEMMSRTNGPFGLHASMTLCDETLALIKNRIGSHPVHGHISESIDDQNAYVQSPVTRLDQAGLINKDSLLAHGVHMTLEDAKTIKARGAILAICTRSNLNNAVGTVDYGLIKSNGIDFVVGTDGLGTNIAASWQDLYYTSKLASGRPNGVDLSDIQRAILKSYTYYERLTGIKLGRFSPGYRFDAMLLDYEAYTPMNAENAFSHIFFGVFDSLDITDVWACGKPLLKDRELLTQRPVDSSLAQKLWDRMGGNHAK